LATLAMPGGDAAARAPWRMAAAALQRAGQGIDIKERFPGQPEAEALTQMLARGLRCPPTSSLGRWFDAAAGLLGVRETSAYEGQAAMLLEALAGNGGAPLSAAALADWVPITPGNTLDPTPLIAWLADPARSADPARAAALFHQAIADGLARWVIAAAEANGLRRVALGGGCFLNALLTSLLVPRLTAQGLQVFAARQAPSNDGGIALGQAWVAICRQNQGT
jgi:hydrogenase maturation protein HypF